MKATGLIIIAAVLALGGGILARGLLSPAEQTRPAPLPDFNLADVSGNQHNISEWQGKIRIINFWATWCPPCLKEIPEFIALQKQYADKGLQFIGIAIDDQEAVAEFLATNKINYPILIGGMNGIALAQQPVWMAQAMRDAVLAGRMAFKSGRIPKKLYASASSPLSGLIGS